MFRKLRSRTGLVLASAVIIGLLASSFAIASGEGKNASRSASATRLQRLGRADLRDADHRQQRHLRHAPVQQVRQRRRRDLRLPLQPAAPRRATSPASAPNLADGRAFEFSSNGGTEVGRITSGNTKAAPFTTNATGVATGLNADQVDGKNAEDITKDATTAAHTDAVAVAQGMTSFAQVAADGSARRQARRGRLHGGRHGLLPGRLRRPTSRRAPSRRPRPRRPTPAPRRPCSATTRRRSPSSRKRRGGRPQNRPFHLTVTC